MFLFGKSQQPKPSTPKTNPISQSSSTSSKPKSLFEERKEWKRSDFLQRVTKTSFTTPTGRTLFHYERNKMMNELFPSNKFGDRISEQEVKNRLRQLKSEEYRAKSSEQRKLLSKQRTYLENVTGLRGKY
jgi:hypothetical protein